MPRLFLHSAEITGYVTVFQTYDNQFPLICANTIAYVTIHPDMCRLPKHNYKDIITVLSEGED